MKSNGDDLIWLPYSSLVLEEALSGDQPVFLDFTADWCLSCKVNERLVLDSSQVKTFFKDEKFILIKGDWTNRNDEIRDYLNSINRNGVPAYVIYLPGHDSEPIVLPEVITLSIIKNSFYNVK